MTAEPVPDVEITEEHLRSLDKQALLTLLADNQVAIPPLIALKDPQAIVDWVIETIAE